MRQDIKNKANRRLKIIEGQIRGLQTMVEDEKYCIDIITQASAIKEALSGVEDLILENHLGTHIVEQIKSGKVDQATKEILKVYGLKRK
ncbi:MAG: metal-sensitive transcriptional regulator [Candidatus Taylorbacteria bacterium]|nr:metal-sensitive transcriptional regulator [Candidatus Taylorbacteria bacterium]